jgi:hypothetical protein
MNTTDQIPNLPALRCLGLLSDIRPTVIWDSPRREVTNAFRLSLSFLPPPSRPSMPQTQSAVTNAFRLSLSFLQAGQFLCFPQIRNVTNAFRLSLSFLQRGSRNGNEARAARSPMPFG